MTGIMTRHTPVPVKDDAETLWDITYSAYIDYSREDDAARAAIATIRTFLAERDATRDAERDAEVDELVAAAKHAHYYAIDPFQYDDSRLKAALAKLETKP